MKQNRMTRLYGAIGILAALIVPKSSKKDRMNDAAAGSFEGMAGAAFTIAAVIVGAVVALILISTLFPTYAGAAKNLTTNVTNADFGNATTNGLLPVFALLISLGALFAIVGLAFLAYRLRK